MSGKYRPYSEYKDSGVTGLGLIPKHWELKRIKEIAIVINGYPFDSKRFESGKGTPLVRIRDINSSQTEVGFDGEVPPEALIKNDDILIGMDGDFNVAMWRGGEAALNQRVACVRANSYKLKKFIFYMLPFNMKIVNDLTYFTTVKHLSSTDILKAKLSLPPTEEIAKIVQFLDHETAKIDTLFEKQQQLIKLLKEKRQAVISHAVTKGLNPNAPMRDSGVDWLGEVPGHWIFTKIKYVSTIKYGIGEPPEYKENGIALVRATNIRSGKISNVNLVFVNPVDIPAKRIVWLESGDIIVVRSGAGTGDSSIIPKAYEGSIAGFDMVVRPIKCSPEFLGHALLSNYIRNNQIDLEKSRAAQPHLNAEELGACFVLVPPLSEQIEIVKEIERELSKFDDLIEKAESAIGLIQERRTALISAAVTGKIDVRNWQAPSQTTNQKIAA